MVFIAGNQIIVTTTSMYYYLWDKLTEYSKLKTAEDRISSVRTLFQVTIANYDEQEFTFNEEGTKLYVNGDTACISVISKDAIQMNEELKEIYDHCQELTRQKHTKWIEETFNKELTDKEPPAYNLKKDKPKLTPINYHQLAMVAMFGIIFNIDKKGSIYAGRCVDIDSKYQYNLENFQDFLAFLEPFVCDENPITSASFDILTYNYCKLYDSLDEKTHQLVERLTLSLVKPNYKD